MLIFKHLRFWKVKNATKSWLIDHKNGLFLVDFGQKTAFFGPINHGNKKSDNQVKKVWRLRKSAYLCIVELLLNVRMEMYGVSVWTPEGTGEDSGSSEFSPVLFYIRYDQR